MVRLFMLFDKQNKNKSELFAYFQKETYTHFVVKRNAPKQDAKKIQNEKKGRGVSEKMVENVENIDIACVSWMDNKSIFLLSTNYKRAAISWYLRKQVGVIAYFMY